jgi:two-component system response regulator HydG
LTRGIHAASARAAGPFIAVNCAALTETLLESELFGHRKGAFTGALQDGPGLFEAASGGTIFLDEVGEMPSTMQAKLLRVLQEGEVTRVGDHQPRRVDVRVIAATNRDLEAEVSRKASREDLFFLAQAAERHAKTIPGVRRAARDLLARHPWPGNVRELQNEIERAVALAHSGEAIDPSHLSRRIAGNRDASPEPVEGDDSADRPLREVREAFEVRYVAGMLRKHAGNVSHTARALGISRVMLQKKMKQYRLRDE